MSVKSHVSWVQMNKHLKCTVAYGTYRNPNWVALCVDELDDTLPRFMGVQWNSVQATHDVSTEAYAWKVAQGRGGTQPDFLITSWTIATRGTLLAYVCRVVRFIPLQGWKMIQIPTTPSHVELSTS
jgi:hypothetical protein